MRRFTQDTQPKLSFKKAIKKPIPIKCVQIDEPFEVESLEGLVTGKSGDWLMIGITGEMYICDQQIFNDSYKLVENP